MRILRTQNAVGRAYGQLDDTSFTEDTGWKALHGDVFRPPPRFMIFSVLVGSGAHVLVTAMFVILLSALGFLSPAISGSRTTALVTIYVLMGYVQTRVGNHLRFGEESGDYHHCSCTNLFSVALLRDLFQHVYTL